MFDFTSIFGQASLPADLFFISAGIALLCGFMIAVAYYIKNKTSKSMLMTLSLLPAIVLIVILMIGDNIGGGIAVAGAFSLVRFRSAPGNALDITVVFFSMAVGLIISVGYIMLAVLVTAIMCAILIGLRFVPVYKTSQNERFLRITLPEDLDFNSELPEVFKSHTTSAKLIKLRTKNMGSLFVADYNIKLISSSHEKALLDELRVKNSNLPISISIKTDASSMEEL